MTGTLVRGADCKRRVELTRKFAKDVTELIAIRAGAAEPGTKGAVAESGGEVGDRIPGQRERRSV